MIDTVLRFSLNHRGLVLAASLALAWVGVRAVYQLPVDAIPDLSENQTIVFVDWPGHGPAEIEQLVTRPLLDHLRGMRGVHTVRSSSDVNFAMVHVIFHEHVDVLAARTRTDEHLRQAVGDLPADAQAYLAPEAPATGQIFWYSLTGAGTDLAELRSIQDSYVRGQLSAVDGVAEVASVGGYRREYHVEVDPLRLAAEQLSLGQVLAAISQAQLAAGGNVVHKAGQEFVVESPGWFGVDDAGQFSLERALDELRQVSIRARDGSLVPLQRVARVASGAAARRGAMEKDGSEVTGGVVMMRYGENPRAVTRRILEKIRQLRGGLPPGVRIVPEYDRTPLIEAAVGTVSGALVEAVLTSVVCVLLILRHVRSSLIIAVTLPLSTLAAFAVLGTLRSLGIGDFPTNIMSLAGLTISIGVLVDSSIVVTENVMHRLRNEVGDQPVVGDTRPIVLEACRTVARPIFLSIMIMLVSFLPVLAIGGSAGKMFRPLALTKTLALAAVALLAITLVPALCSLLVRGRLRREEDSWLVRTLIDVYRPLLNYLLDRPVVMFWIMGATLILGLAPLGQPWLIQLALAAGMLACGWAAQANRSRWVALVSIVLVALVAGRMRPLEHETNLITPLDEGTVMDMPITIPRVSLTQALDDLKARDMMICRFPEVEMAMGKVGRAETPTDPAPVDMIETMVSLRPREFWPRRKLANGEPQRIADEVLNELIARQLLAPLPDAAARTQLREAALAYVMPRFDAQMREVAYQRNHEFLAGLPPDMLQAAVRALVAAAPRRSFRHWPSDADIAAVATRLSVALVPHHGSAPGVVEVEQVVTDAAAEFQSRQFVDDVDDLLHPQSDWSERASQFTDQLLGRRSPTLLSRVRDQVASRLRYQWGQHARQLDRELVERGAGTIVRLLVEDLLRRAPTPDAELLSALQRIESQRENPPVAKSLTASHHHGQAANLDITPLPQVDGLQIALTQRLVGKLVLWRATRNDLGGFGGEMDQALQMPGWTNVWTRPIQNRVDMLNTGVGSTAVAIRVLGHRLDDVVSAGDEVAAVVRSLPGAANVIADPVRGKSFLEIRVDRPRAADRGVQVGDIQAVVQAATGGTVVGQVIEGHDRHAIRVRLERSWREDDESLRRLPVPTAAGDSYVTLDQVATIQTREGPAAIKGENGMLRTYVRLDVRGRDAADFVDQARSVVARRVALPAGTYLEWTGGFEYYEASRRTLVVIVPIAVLLTFGLLYLTFRDLGDAVLMMLTVPGAVAGGCFLQWLWGCKFSLTVAIGYLSCFGMATATGVIMLVYLREAVDLAGGLERMDLAGLRAAVLRGAVHRLRPKLLTEATTLIGLAPMLWASGVGAEVIAPMAVPVLGGILVADEVIDLFLPVLFYWVRRQRWRRLHGITRFATTAGNQAEPTSSVVPWPAASVSN